MKERLPLRVSSLALLCVALTTSGSNAASASAKVSPLPKVIQLITDLQAKTLKDGEAAQRTYDKFVTWCQLTSQEKQQTIKVSTAEKGSLEAAIQKAESNIEELESRIQKLSGSIATDEADLKAATQVRKKRREDFEAADKELVDIISTLERAQSVLEKELMKIHSTVSSGSAFLDRSGAKKDEDEVQLLKAALGDDSVDRIMALTQSFGALVDAAGILSSGPVTGDVSRFQMLVQMQEGASADDSDADADGDSDDMGEVGAPSAAAYKTVSGGLLKTLASTQQKAETSQDELRKKESAEQHEYDLFKQSLTEKLSTESKELEASKKALAGAKEKKAAAEGNLEMTMKELKSTQASLQKMQHDCMARANDHEAAMKERQAELEALSKAKKVIQDVSNPEGSSPSFLQVQRASSRAWGRNSNGLKVLQRLRDLGAQIKSPALTQVVSQLHSMLSGGEVSGADPFKKVTNMIKNMIKKLTDEANQEQVQKEFCDREMAHTLANKEDKESQVEELTTKLEKAVADGLKLKEEVSMLSAEITDIKKSQAEMDQIRAEEKAEFLDASKDMKESISAVQSALGILRDYYSTDSDQESLVQTDMKASMQAVSQGPDEGSAKGIIALLELAEADFSKNLAEAEASEQAAIAEYEKISQDNKEELAVKSTEVKNKEQQVTALRKTGSELTADRAEVQSELDAVLEYYEKLKPQCIAKPESYEERMARRESEINGLKEAIVILGEEAIA